MAKGYQANKERKEALTAFGKELGKRAGFKCEWCESKDDLRPWDYNPDQDPEMGNLALLCARCRGLANGSKADLNELRSIRNALWSDVPAFRKEPPGFWPSAGIPGRAKRSGRVLSMTT